MSKRLAASAAALIMVLGGGITPTNQFDKVINITASADTYLDFYYRTLKDGTLEVTNYYGNESTITIPSIIDGKTVSSVYASGWDSIETINLPNTLKKLNVSSLKSLKVLIIPSSIEKLDIYSCDNIKELNIPDSVKDLDVYSCNNLEKIIIPDNLAADYSIGSFLLNVSGYNQNKKQVTVVAAEGSFVEKASKIYDGLIFQSNGHKIVIEDSFSYYHAHDREGHETEGIYLSDYKGVNNKVVIPDTYDGQKVIGLYYTFGQRDTTITEVEFPNREFDVQPGALLESSWQKNLRLELNEKGYFHCKINDYIDYKYSFCPPMQFFLFIVNTFDFCGLRN